MKLNTNKTEGECKCTGNRGTVTEFGGKPKCIECGQPTELDNYTTTKKERLITEKPECICGIGDGNYNPRCPIHIYHKPPSRPTEKPMDWKERIIQDTIDLTLKLYKQKLLKRIKEMTTYMSENGGDEGLSYEEGYYACRDEVEAVIKEVKI